MKMLIAIIQDEDATKLLAALMNEGYSVTKLATTGGFLRAGNTTVLLGVEENRLAGALAVIERTCSSRRQVGTSQSPITGTPGMEEPHPIEVTVGGATIFVIDVEQFARF